MALILRKSANTVESKPLLGGAMVTGSDGILPPTGTLHGIFDEISKQENVTGVIDYRCIYLENPRDAIEAAGTPRIRILSQSESEISIGVLQKNIQAQAIGNEKEAPSGVVFRTQKEIEAQNSDKMLKFPSTSQLLPGEYCAVWLKRQTKASNGSGVITEEVVLDIQWDE